MAFEAGQHVEARFGGKSRYYGATVMKNNGDGSYELMYDDGDSEKSVVEALIRHSSSSSSSSSSTGGSGAFEAGQRIEARFGGKSKYYGGTIVKANGDGTYEIKYDDGDSEKRVAEDLVRSEIPAPSASSALARSGSAFSTSGGDAEGAGPSSSSSSSSGGGGGLGALDKLNAAAQKIDAAAPFGVGDRIEVSGLVND